MPDYLKFFRVCIYFTQKIHKWFFQFHHWSKLLLCSCIFFTGGSLTPWTCFLPFSRVSRSTLKDAEQRRPLPQAAGGRPSKPLLIYHPPCSPLFSNPIIFFGDPFTQHHLHQINWRCAACEQPCLVSLSRRLNRWNRRFNWFIFFFWQ